MRHPLRPLNGGSVSIVLIGVLTALIAALPASPVRAQFNQLIVSAGGPYNGTPGTPVTMFAQVSGGFGGTFQYFWSFGDGTQGSGQSVTKVYSSAGSFTVQVSVSSSSGQTGTATTSAFISGSGGFGQVSAGGPYSGQPGQAIVFTGSAPFGTGAQQYIWNFGDGTQGSGQTVSHVYNTAGTYSVTLTVTGTTGQAGTATTTANVGTQGTSSGLVSAGGPYTGVPGQSITLSGFAPGVPNATQYIWNFGDGTSGSGQTVTHAYNTAGSFSATLTVTNSTGLSYSGTAVVNVTGTATTFPSSTATTVVPLVAGCNNIASTWPNNTATTTAAAGVSPPGSLLAIWRWSAAANRYEGFSITGAAVSDLRTINLLESLFFCLSSAGYLTRPVF